MKNNSQYAGYLSCPHIKQKYSFCLIFTSKMREKDDFDVKKDAKIKQNVQLFNLLDERRA